MFLLVCTTSFCSFLLDEDLLFALVGALGPLFFFKILSSHNANWVWSFVWEYSAICFLPNFVADKIIVINEVANTAINKAINILNIGGIFCNTGVHDNEFHQIWIDSVGSNGENCTNPNHDTNSIS